MLKPNLFIVGAAKAGTTSLYSYLNNHPKINASIIKEPHFFSDDIRCKDMSPKRKKRACFNQEKYFAKEILAPKHIAYIESQDNYLKLFDLREDYSYFLDASTGYLHSKSAAQNIYDFNKDAKIIISLRHPAERAYSHFLMDLSGGMLESKDFIKEIERQRNKKNRNSENNLYIEGSLYARQIERYMDIFPKENIMIVFQDELNRDTQKIMDGIFDFLDLDSIKVDIEKRENAGKVPRSFRLNNFMMKFVFLRDFIPQVIKDKVKLLLQTPHKQKMSSAEREYILGYVKEDIKALEKLLDRDLSGWLV
jgi:hypothetical protein